MTLPRILTIDGVWGFTWARADGTPSWLADLLTSADAEPHRWLPTHLKALDDELIALAGRYGDVLGGRSAAAGEQEQLTAAYAAVDRACLEYAVAADTARLPEDIRAGQILGSAALMGIRCRAVLGLVGPAPFDGELDPPPRGVIAGRAGLHPVSRSEPWRGSRWLVRTDDGRRLPATLSMLLGDSSGVDRQATLREHREALAVVTAAVLDPAADPITASGALDWLLFDWLMAHRDGPDSAAVQVDSGPTGDAAVIVAAVATSVRTRLRFDPALMAAIPERSCRSTRRP